MARIRQHDLGSERDGKTCVNSRYSQAQAADSLEPNSLDGNLLDTSNSTTTANESSPNASRTDTLSEPQYSAISEHSSVKGTPKVIREWLMSSQQDFHANRSHNLVKEEQKKTLATCGRKLDRPLASLDPDTLSWRTSQACLISHTQDEYSQIWPRWGSIVNGELWGQMTLGFVITGSDSGWYVNTPAAGSEKWGGRFEEAGGSGNKYRGTPIAREKVNPRWWEWLMGWPSMWSNLSPLETDKFQSWLQQHGVFYREK